MNTTDKITVTRSVTLRLTADDWALYDLPGRDLIAECLNREVAAAINTPSSNRDAAQKEAGGVLNAFAKYGADDTEGWYTLEDIFTRVYAGE